MATTKHTHDPTYGNIRTIRVPTELWRAAKTKAKAEHVTVSGIIRDALTTYVAS